VIQPSQPSYQDRLVATGALVLAEITRRRVAGHPTCDLEAHAAELADYLDIERCAAQRRQELPGR
jgi:hypothetical protein